MRAKTPIGNAFVQPQPVPAPNTGVKLTAQWQLAINRICLAMRDVQLPLSCGFKQLPVITSRQHRVEGLRRFLQAGEGVGLVGQAHRWKE